MEKYLNKFYDIVDKIGKHNVILIIFIFFVVLTTTLYQTFSIYTESEGLSLIDGIQTYSFILNNNNTTNSVTIAAGNSKNIDITISNESATNLKYQVYYTSTADLTNVFIAHPHNTINLPVGTIPSDTSYVLTVKVQNNSSTDVTIDFGLKYGFENADDLTLDDGQYSIEGYSMMKTLFETPTDNELEALEGALYDDYWKNATYNSYIKTASFVDYIDTTNAVEYWDVSMNEDNSVVAWVNNNETEGYYDLYIGSENKIYAESLASLFFNIDFTNEESGGTMIALESISFDNLDTSVTTDMSLMFNGCRSLTSLDVSNFNTSSVTDMNGMFVGCGSLTSLNLSNFDTSNVTNMAQMFQDCSNLTTEITIRNSGTIDYNVMFSGAATATDEEGNSIAQITVNYTTETSDLVTNMVNTKSDNSNVIKSDNPVPILTTTETTE